MRALLVETILAAAIVGAVEATRAVVLAGAGFAPGPWLVLAALACAGAVVAAFGARLAIAIVPRLPPFAAWARDLDAPATRPVAVWRIALATTTAAAATAAIFVTASRVHESFRFSDGAAVGLIVAATTIPILAGLALGALALDRAVAPRLRRSPHAEAALAGPRRHLATAAGVAAIALLPPLGVRLAVPALDLDPALAGSLVLAAVVGVRAARPRRLIAVAILAAVPLGVWGLAASEPARGILVVHGTYSRTVARLAWSLADADGDGYAGALGGADCDDGNPAVHPNAPEIAGNQLDENCTGADAPAATLARFAQPVPPAIASTDRPSIVIITVDALRADHLGAYGYARPTSPALDAFAATATRFAWAITPAPTTRWAVPSMMTGRFPSVLRDDTPTLATTLAEAAYETVAIVCCERFAPGSRDVEGFATVDVSPDAVRLRRAGQSNADAVADAALRFLARPHPRPFFLWLHFYDPHHPYLAPEHPRRFGASDLARYDAEIVYTDAHVQRVLAAFDPRTVVVFSADHGEAFGEHGNRFHARELFNPTVHIPLIIRAPGGAPRVVTTPVSLADVAPTVLDLANLPAPAGMNGRSLAAAVRSPAAPAPARPILTELVPGGVIHRDVAAILDGDWKVQWDREANAWTLHSLADPTEADRAAAHPELLGPLRQKLLETLDRELSLPP